MVLSSIFSGDNQRDQRDGNQTGGGPASNDIATLIIKNRGFLAKIFTNLIVQLAITYYVMENYPVPENKWLYFFGSLGLVLVIAGTNLPYWAKFGVFVLFSYLLGRLSAVYKKKYSEEVIRNGILGAMGIFAIMFVVGALVPVLGYQFGMGLFFALLALLIARIVALFSENGSEFKKLLSGAGIGIFGLYVAYDTNNILKRAHYYQGDFITASMDYYLDIINLVQDVMRVNH
jgi:FtsH-binding integral membrane protein